MDMQMRAPVVELEPDVDKIIAAIAFVIREAETQGLSVSQYDIVKTIFLADKRHLNEYERPVVFDNYTAMVHGPVPSLTYDLLKGNTFALRKHHLKSVLWQKRAAPEMEERAFAFDGAELSDDVDDVLSESDAEALSAALTTIKSLTFGQIRRLTHDDSAYKEAWDYQPNSNTAISYGLIFDEPDYERAEILSMLSKHR
jgi:uncharacterized phage-associated protein